MNLKSWLQQENIPVRIIRCRISGIYNPNEWVPYRVTSIKGDLQLSWWE
jgi:hypothetical protein